MQYFYPGKERVGDDEITLTETNDEFSSPSTNPRCGGPVRKRKQRGKSEAKQLHELSDTESANSGTIIDTPLINSYTIYMFF